MKVSGRERPVSSEEETVVIEKANGQNAANKRLSTLQDQI